jgi:hypothetical protein
MATSKPLTQACAYHVCSTVLICFHDLPLDCIHLHMKTQHSMLAERPPSAKLARSGPVCIQHLCQPLLLRTVHTYYTIVYIHVLERPWW